MNIFNY